MHPILIEFELPEFLRALFFQNIPSWLGWVLLVMGFVFLFLGPPTRRQSALDGAEANERIAKSDRRLAIATFWFGLLCLVAGVLSIGINSLENPAQETAQRALITTAASVPSVSLLNTDATRRDAFAASLQRDVLLKHPKTLAAAKAERFRALVLNAAVAPITEPQWRELVHKDPLPLDPVKVPSYGVMVMLGFIAAILIALFRARQYRIDPNIIIDIGIVAMVFGILGARLWYVLQFWERDFADKPLSNVFQIQQGGIVIYGGLVGATVACMAYLKIKRQPLWFFADWIVLTVPIGQAFGRIGCYLNGCCYGYACDVDTLFFTTTPREAGPVLATQFISSFALVGLFALGTWYYERWARRRGETFWFVVVAYAAFRLTIEFWRKEPSYTLFTTLTIAQWFSLVMLLAGIPAWYYFRYRSRQAPPHLAGLADVSHLQYTRPAWATKRLATLAESAIGAAGGVPKAAASSAPAS